MVVTSDETQIQTFADWPMSHDNRTTAKIQDIMPLSSQGDCGCGQTKTFRQKIHVQTMLKMSSIPELKRRRAPKNILNTMMQETANGKLLVYEASVTDLM